MKASEIREMSLDEMRRKSKDLKEKLFTLRFQHATGQLENSRKLGQTKKDIARVNTIILQSDSNDSRE
ncbi:MAG: 50S ribosomal protein L29 [Desulfobacterales bacterium]|nr:50S ribosomal protein L29 [Desulfobacterales bacterium]